MKSLRDRLTFSDFNGGVAWTLTAFAWIAVASLIVLALTIVAAIVFDSTHVCVRAGDSYYHPPTYVKSGVAYVPVGGGVYSDCLEYRAK